MRSHVPAIAIPDEIIRRLRGVPSERGGPQNQRGRGAAAAPGIERGRPDFRRGGMSSMETIIRSTTREVRIGPDRPFVIIGERINPTGRAKLAAEMAAGDFDRVRADARAQAEAGAQVLDVNAGIPLVDEPALLAEAVRAGQSVVETPLSIDSSIIKALEAGLAAYQGKPLVNSVTGGDEGL